MLSLWTFLQVARKWYCISLVVLFLLILWTYWIINLGAIDFLVCQEKSTFLNYQILISRKNCKPINSTIFF